MTYYVIGDEDSVLGFGLVGVAGREAGSAEEAREAFQAALREEEVGVLIIAEATAELIREEIDRFTFTEDFPLVVEIPDRRGKRAGRPGIRELAHHAIGIEL